MKIYTKTGDDGTTSLFGGKRLSKADVQIDAYGSLDELTSILGVFTTHIKQDEEITFIQDIQKDLYVMMGFLAHAPTDLTKQKEKIVLFEKKIDTLTAKLPPLTQFIIPSGSPASCWAHVSRVTARKAERAIILSFETQQITKDVSSQIVLAYINRLSDLLFTYARIFNEESELISKKL
jgi:cob(I)alamin adenosyltransferase